MKIAKCLINYSSSEKSGKELEHTEMWVYAKKGSVHYITTVGLQLRFYLFCTMLFQEALDFS